MSALIIHAGDTRYVVSADGTISYHRPGHKYQGSKDWRLVGLVLLYKRAPIIPLDQVLENGLPDPLYFKNGKCRYTVMDIDHGTWRQWGSPRISSMFVEP